MRFFLVTKTSNGFFTKGFVEMIDREMAGIGREMARIDREMAGIDREMAGNGAETNMDRDDAALVSLCCCWCQRATLKREEP